jgi:sugar phosphate isomerase/epimerase
MQIGAQAYTIRNLARDEREIERAFCRMAELGFRCMQASGMGPIAPEKLRDLSDQYGVEIAITHSNPERILNDTEALIREHKIYHCPRIGLGCMPEKYRHTLEGMRAFLRDFTPAAQKMAEHGMKLHYHNHSMEFARCGEKTLFDLMVEETSPEQFAFIPDVYWIQVAGRNPAKQLRMLKGRVEVCHLKDLAVVEGDQRMAAVMEGNLDWDDILAVCRETGIAYGMIEQDDCYGEDPFDCLRRSYENLKKAGF